MTRDPFFDDEDDARDQAHATTQRAVEAGRILQEFALKWVDGGRTRRSVRVRRVAWDIACGSAESISSAAAKLGISRQCLYRVVAACKAFRFSYRL